MPKSHFPVRGGPQPSAWTSRPFAPSKENDAPVGATMPQGKPSLHSLEAENQRLKQELERVRKSEPAGISSPPASHHMVWIACALCGAAFLFALAALWTR